MKFLELPFWSFYERIWNGEYHYTTFDNEHYWLCVFLSVILLFVLYLVGWLIYGLIYDLIDNRKSYIVEQTGKLIDKRYVGEQTTQGTGTAVVSTGNGVGVGIVSTSSHKDEEFLFFIQADRIYKIVVDMENFYHFDIGDRIKFEVKVGGISNRELKSNII